jgi:hypothetical protein
MVTDRLAVSGAEHRPDRGRGYAGLLPSWIASLQHGVALTSASTVVLLLVLAYLVLTRSDWCGPGTADPTTTVHTRASINTHRTTLQPSSSLSTRRCDGDDSSAAWSTSTREPPDLIRRAAGHRSCDEFWRRTSS